MKTDRKESLFSRSGKGRRTKPGDDASGDDAIGDDATSCGRDVRDGRPATAAWAVASR